MRYYRKPERVGTGYCVIEVTVQPDFQAYIKSCTGKTVRYAYTKRSAKPFSGFEEAGRYIEKHHLRGRYPLGCGIVLIPGADARKIA